jgi:hypothetical protein
MLALKPYSVGNSIDQSTKVWNEQLVQNLFATETTQNILNTPLHQQVDTDRLVWKAEKNGCYSVRSAYRICIEDIIINDHLRKPGYWSGIWKLKAPLKVRNLVWRVCRECFPTRVKLKSIGVNRPSTCVTCNDPHEDSYHIFFHCKTAIDAWSATNVWNLNYLFLNLFDYASNIIFNLLHQLSVAQIETIVTIIWSI